MEMFIANPDGFMDDFSRSFESGYLEVLKRVWGVRRVHANKVYNEYIKDAEHTHMNSTVWATLSIFVEYLGRVGKCIIDQTEEGYFVTLIEVDPEKDRRMAEAEERRLLDESKEARHTARLEAAARARAEALEAGRIEGTGLQRAEGEAIAAVKLRGVVRRRPVLTAARSAATASAPAHSEHEEEQDAAEAAEAAAGEEVENTTGRAGKRIRWQPAAPTVDLPPSSSAGAAGSLAAAIAEAAKRARHMAASQSSAVAPATASTPGRLSGMEALISEIEASKARSEDPPSRVEPPEAARASAGFSSPARSDQPAAVASVLSSGMAAAASNWARGAMVRVLNREVDGGRYFQAKGTVTKIKAGEGDVGSDLIVVKIKPKLPTERAVRLLLPASGVESLLAKPGGDAIGLAWPLTGQRLRVLRVDLETSTVDVQLLSNGTEMRALPFDAVAKLDVDYFETKVAGPGAASA